MSNKKHTIMKKLLSCLVVILVSISASAQVQFYQYKPYQPSNTHCLMKDAKGKADFSNKNDLCGYCKSRIG